MYLSQLWCFLVAVVAIIAITFVVTLPRPAQRAALRQEEKELRNACLVGSILLRDNARSRLQLTSDFSQAIRQRRLATAIGGASKEKKVSAKTHGLGRKGLNQLLETISGAKPNFVWLIDNRGRVVARSGQENKSFGDSVRGYYLVQDALNGYVRDDLWMMKEGLFRVSAAPILTQNLQWAGAIVVGHHVDKEFATSLSENIGTDINFYVSGHTVATSNPVQIQEHILSSSDELKTIPFGEDCTSGKIVRVRVANDSYSAINARLPGEAGEQGAFYSVFAKQAAPLSVLGMISAADKTDFNFGHFPWISIAIAFLLFLGITFFILYWEMGRPLKRLCADAVAMAKGSQSRFSESAHRGQHGSIARSVNICVEKMLHESTKTIEPAPASKDDAPPLHVVSEGGSYSASSSALPFVAPAAFPPPSEFKFSDKNLDHPEAGTTLAAAVNFADKSPVLPSLPPTLRPEPDDHQPLHSPILKEATDSHIIPEPVPLPFAATSAISTAPQETIGMEGEIPFINTLKTNADDHDLLEDSVHNSSDQTPPPPPPSSTHDQESIRYFYEVYDEFITLRENCGEATDSPTFERFSAKLLKNQEALIAKHDCVSVKFHVYAKDGRAALKASPVKSSLSRGE